MSAARTEVAIVGAGPAGCSAAAQCARLGLGPMLFDRRGEAGGLVVNAWRIENHPGPKAPVSGEEYARSLEGLLDRFGITVEKAEVQRLERSGRDIRLVLASGDALLCSTVILATGTRPLKAGFFGEDLCPPVYTEVRELAPTRPSRALVVGGGEAALDYALNLAERGTRVTVLVRSSRYRARGRLPRLVSGSARIDVMMSSRVTKVLPAEFGAVAEVCLQGDRPVRMETGAVVVAVGRRLQAPALPEDVTLRERGGARGMPGLFAAGDLVAGGLGQACTAAGDGIRAAELALRYLLDDGLADDGGQ